jgi:hypothetical protein
VKVEVTDKEILEALFCGGEVSERDFARKTGCSMRRIYDVINEHCRMKGSPCGDGQFGVIEREHEGNCDF